MQPIVEYVTMASYITMTIMYSYNAQFFKNLDLALQPCTHAEILPISITSMHICIPTLIMLNAYIIRYSIVGA